MRTTVNDQLRSIAGTEQPHSVPIARPGLALAAALLGFFVITLDAVVVNVALPSIRSDLSAGMTGLRKNEHSATQPGGLGHWPRLHDHERWL